MSARKQMPVKMQPEKKNPSSLLSLNRRTQQDIIHHRRDNDLGSISQNEAFQAKKGSPLRYHEILKHLDNSGELRDKNQLIAIVQAQQQNGLERSGISEDGKLQEKAMLEEKLAQVKASLADVVEEENQRLRRELAELESELREMYGVDMTPGKILPSAAHNSKRTSQGLEIVVPSLDLSPIVSIRRQQHHVHPYENNIRALTNDDSSENQQEMSDVGQSDSDNDSDDGELLEFHESLEESISQLSTPRNLSFGEERKVLKLKGLLQKTMSVLEFYRNLSEQQHQQQSPTGTGSRKMTSSSPEGALTSEHQLEREVEKMNLQIGRITQELRLRNVQNEQLEQEINRLRSKMDNLRRKYVTCKQENLVMKETIRDKEQREQEYMRERRRLELLEQQTEEVQQENENLLLSVKLLQTQSKMLRSQLDSAEVNKKQAERHSKRLERLLQNLKIGPLKQLQDSQSLRQSQSHALQRSLEHEGEIVPPYAHSSVCEVHEHGEESTIQVELSNVDGEVYISDGRHREGEKISLGEYLETFLIEH